MRKAIASPRVMRSPTVEYRINIIMTQSTASNLLLQVGNCQQKTLLPATDANAEV
ncbi:hypothetical protein LC613_31230 [Nostoc sphaeroides CHAB 2801]|uniref:hypothetical protein n=1 Tax=Nostoc sphaeroides TaxID=446679 RepID=UPI001E2B5F62|nr:hypothetical protein [Nostoc sphaeroides]MCC5632140.1 hypothetical protein [Nostoc sphaeroides CHAB 2801]